MPWDPALYNQYKDIRYQPFYDLMDLITDDPVISCVDIGCGTGEQTSILADRFSKAICLGIDSSHEMLQGSAFFEHERLHFEHQDIESFPDTDTCWDLIFSNAALQWTEDHKALFPKLISQLNAGGQLAIQMPLQKENKLNQLLLQLVNEEPYVSFLHSYQRKSPVLEIDEYVQLMFKENLDDLNVFVKVYPIEAKSEEDLYNFIAGTALIPYLDRLKAEQQIGFKAEYLKRIREHFEPFPAIYSFKRIFLYVRKK